MPTPRRVKQSPEAESCGQVRSCSRGYHLIHAAKFRMQQQDDHQYDLCQQASKIPSRNKVWQSNGRHRRDCNKRPGRCRRVRREDELSGDNRHDDKKDQTVGHCRFPVTEIPGLRALHQAVLRSTSALSKSRLDLRRARGSHRRNAVSQANPSNVSYRENNATSVARQSIGYCVSSPS